jgi:hypothetical protein
LVTWDPDIFELRSYLSTGGILLKGRFLATGQEVAFLNVYGPCSNKPYFWNQLANSGLLSLPNLILGGDLNFILKAEEHWGGSFQPGPTEATYREIFATNNLIDVQPLCLMPTWRNGRTGSEAIARRLDRFFIAEAFLTSQILPATWVEYPFFSDHAPVLLKLIPPALHRATPYKFNYHWLQRADYTSLVKGVWSDHVFLAESNPQRRIAWKLSVLKSKQKSGSRI